MSLTSGVRRLARLAVALPSRLRRGGLALGLVGLLLTVPLLVSPGADPSPSQLTGAGGIAPRPDGQTVTAGPGSPDPQELRPESGLPEVVGAPKRPPGTVPTDPGESAPPRLAEKVRGHAPDLVARPPTPLAPDRVSAALRLPAVEKLVVAGEATVEIEAPRGPRKVRAFAVDPVAFRPLTPEATAQTKGVWERMTAGEMVVRHDMARRMGLKLGGRVTVTGPNGQPARVRVGAFASNGAPPLTDVLVPWSTGQRLGIAEPNLVVVAVTDERDEPAVADRIRAAVGGEVTRIKAPPSQRARLVGVGSHHFDPFSYVDHGDGMITIDPDWVRENITSVDLPIFGVARCHRVMVPQLVEALREIQRAGLAHLLNPNHYGGCWVPRHMLFDPNLPISMHAWGLAIDFNVRTNQYGVSPQLDHRIVAIFQRWGFEWGGQWSTPDGMHFELRTVMRDTAGS